MRIIILITAIALLTVAALWLQIGALALVIAPLAGLFFLLALTPVFVEAMEAELAEGETQAPAEPAMCVDTNVRWGVLYVSDR